MMDMDRQQKSVSRRELLRGTAAAAAFMIVPSHVLAGAAGQRPSDKLNLAAIGIGNMGSGNISQCHTENFVALCDVDDNYAKHVFDKFPNAGKYKDFRVMLDKEDKNIDGVVIATPDHTHYVVAMACLQHRKHIYLQKPLAHSIAEVRKLTETARAAKVQTQMVRSILASAPPRGLRTTPNRRHTTRIPASSAACVAASHSPATWARKPSPGALCSSSQASPRFP